MNGCSECCRKAKRHDRVCSSVLAQPWEERLLILAQSHLFHRRAEWSEWAGNDEMRMDRERPPVKVDFRAAKLFPLTAFTFEPHPHLQSCDCWWLALMKYVIKSELVARRQGTYLERRSRSAFNKIKIKVVYNATCYLKGNFKVSDRTNQNLAWHTVERCQTMYALLLINGVRMTADKVGDITRGHVRLLLCAA